MLVAAALLTAAGVLHAARLVRGARCPATVRGHLMGPLPHGGRSSTMKSARRGGDRSGQWWILG